MHRLTHDCRQHAERALESAWQAPGPLRLDFSNTEAIDAVGAALLLRLVERAQRAQRPVHSAHLRPHLQAYLQSVPCGRAASRLLPPPEGLLGFLGGAAYAAFAAAMQMLVLMSELSFFALDALRGSRKKVLGLRREAVWLAMEDVGARAAPIVMLIAFLVGLTVALQSAVQLRPFGATVFVVDLIGLSVCRELGPLMAAIVVAGRSGSACAAQVATMVVTEEWDALRAMGIHPVAYTVLPKLLAILLMQPLVALCANAASILGAFGVCVLALDIPASVFVDRLAESVLTRDLLLGACKSMAFGALVVLVAARSGLAVQGGAEGVGRSTTRSVVVSIFFIIVTDALFSFTFYSEPA